MQKKTHTVIELNEDTNYPKTQTESSQLSTQAQEEDNDQWTSIQTKRQHKTTTTQQKVAFSSTNPFTPLSDLDSTDTTPKK
jgi:hypothetical protein